MGRRAGGPARQRAGAGSPLQLNRRLPSAQGRGRLPVLDAKEVAHNLQFAEETHSGGEARVHLLHWRQPAPAPAPPGEPLSAAEQDRKARWAAAMRGNAPEGRIAEGAYVAVKVSGGALRRSSKTQPAHLPQVAATPQGPLPSPCPLQVYHTFDASTGELLDPGHNRASFWAGEWGSPWRAGCQGPEQA